MDGIARGHLASECRQKRGVSCDEALGPSDIRKELRWKQQRRLKEPRGQ